MNPCKNIIWSEVEKKNVCKLGLMLKAACYEMHDFSNGDGNGQL